MKFLYQANGWAQNQHLFAKAIFNCVKILYRVSKPKGGLSLMRLTLFPHLFFVVEITECNQLVLDLAKDMACTLGYNEGVKQLARLGQLKQAIQDVKPLMEDTTNFIVKFTDGQDPSSLPYPSTVANSAVPIALRSLLSSRKQEQIDNFDDGDLHQEKVGQVATVKARVGGYL